MEYEVKSVSEYIKVIKQLQINSMYPLIYRGQSKGYQTMNSTAFRMDLLDKGSLRQGYPFKKIIEEFKYEVWTELDDDTRKTFLAFCQHHSIPTNLLDFTENPLIALYFAVSNEEAINETGYVYIINKPYLNITDIIENYNLTEQSIFEILCSENYTLLLELYNKILFYEEKYPTEFYKTFKFLWDDINHFNKPDNKEYLYEDTIILDIEKDIYDQMNHINYENKDLINVPVYNNVLQTDFDKMIYEEFPSNNVTAYLLYLRFFIKLLNVERRWPEYFRGLIPMVYKPILNFKRGINQKGLFVYQNYLEQDPWKTDGYIDYTVQNIETNYVIKIPSHKLDIKQTLDLLDINQKFVYGDFENTANYIFSKYNNF